MVMNPKQIGKVLTFANYAAGLNAFAPSIGSGLENVRAIVFNQTTAGSSLQIDDPVDSAVINSVDLINTGTVDLSLVDDTLNSIATAKAGKTTRMSWTGAKWIGYSESSVTNDRVFLSETLVAPASAGSPTVAEINAAIGAATDVIAHYNGTDIETDTPTHAYAVDGSGNVTVIEHPVTASGLVDQSTALTANTTVSSWDRHLSVTSATAPFTITLPAASGNIGKVIEIYNGSAFDQTIAKNAADSINGSPTDLVLPPNSGVTIRAIAATKVEMVGIGKPIEEVAGTNGHIIIGDTMLQWGRFTSTLDSDEAFLFPTTFGGVPYTVIANIAHNLGTTVTGRVLQSSITATGFSFNREDTIGAVDTPTIHWSAIGPKP